MCTKSALLVSARESRGVAASYEEKSCRTDLKRAGGGDPSGRGAKGRDAWIFGSARADCTRPNRRRWTQRGRCRLCKVHWRRSGYVSRSCLCKGQAEENVRESRRESFPSLLVDEGHLASSGQTPARARCPSCTMQLFRRKYGFHDRK